MIEIKFRFWNKNTEMMMPDSEGWSDNLGINEMFEGMSHLDIIPMQFTGLKDKNGKDIYEGDILQCADDNINHPSKKNFEVVYRKSCFVLQGGESFEYYATIEIIGNIYENPDLLK